MAVSSRRALHYVLKIGDREASVAFYRDLLGMTPLRHEEFDGMCEATCNGPYDNKWSKTMIGYGPEDNNFVLVRQKIQMHVTQWFGYLLPCLTFVICHFYGCVNGFLWLKVIFGYLEVETRNFKIGQIFYYNLSIKISTPLMRLDIKVY